MRPKWCCRRSWPISYGQCYEGFRWILIRFLGSTRMLFIIYAYPMHLCLCLSAYPSCEKMSRARPVTCSTRSMNFLASKFPRICGLTQLSYFSISQLATTRSSEHFIKLNERRQHIHICHIVASGHGAPTWFRRGCARRRAAPWEALPRRLERAPPPPPTEPPRAPAKKRTPAAITPAFLSPLTVIWLLFSNFYDTSILKD